MDGRVLIISVIVEPTVSATQTVTWTVGSTVPLLISVARRQTARRWYDHRSVFSSQCLVPTKDFKLLTKAPTLPSSLLLPCMPVCLNYTVRHFSQLCLRLQISRGFLVCKLSLCWPPDSLQQPRRIASPNSNTPP